MSSLLKEVGLVGEESSPTRISIKSKHPLPVGTYIYLKYEVRDPITGGVSEREVVGLVGATQFKSLIQVVSGRPTPIEDYPELLELKRESIMNAILIADITNEEAPKPPEYPPPPESKVYLALPEHLRIVYSQNPEESIKVGTLVGHGEVEVRVNVNALVKHLLVTGVTGSGKSNFVAVLADRIAGLGGCVVVFDTHGEYRIESEAPSRVEVIPYEASINLVKTPIGLLSSFIVPEPGATKQRRILRNALRDLNKEIEEKASRKGLPLSKAVVDLYESNSRDVDELDCIKAYRELLKERILSRASSPTVRGRSSRDDKAIESVIDKIDDFFEWHRVSLDTPRVSEHIAPGRIIDVDVSGFTDGEQDWMLKVIAEDILWALKEKGKDIVPTLLVVEEAHIFLNEWRSTVSKEAIQRFVREGRKFGAMLAIVSQRPRTLDTAIVSQVQNFAFFKLVQSSDRSKVIEFSDILSEEYADLMPSFPPGHAILVGEWVGRFTVYAHIDRHGGKKLGASPRVIDAWREALERSIEDARKSFEKSSLIQL
ncbi:MAG: ATP-binding protein [Desulfurococcaceae archaeon]|nr:ATP-binding protein [Sulfolobales archaeon]MDW8170666.1 ATP-binding protein [Desulfurococcaceae archaeon]